MFGRNRFEVAGKLVVISGASQGAGLAIAKLLASKGANLVLVSRSESKLAAAAKLVNEIVSESAFKDQRACQYLAADLARYSDCDNVLQKLDDIPDITICCVGASIPKLFTELSSSELEMGVSTNYSSALYLSHCVMKRIASSKDAKERHIVFFSSVLSYFSFIGYAQYAPLKAALQSLAGILDQEGVLYNCKVHCVYPGNFESAGFLEEQKTKPQITQEIEGSSVPISSAKCAELVVKSLEQGHEFITTDLVGWLLSFFCVRKKFSLDWLLSLVVSFVLFLISPIAEWVIRKQIKDHYKDEKKSN